MFHLTDVGGCGFTRIEPVTYDDGEEEWTDLSTESIKWLDGKAKVKATEGKAKPATTSRGRVRMYTYRVRCVHLSPRASCGLHSSRPSAPRASCPCFSPHSAARGELPSAELMTEMFLSRGEMRVSS